MISPTIQSVAQNSQNWTACKAAVLPQCVTPCSPCYSLARQLNSPPQHCHPTPANLNFTTFQIKSLHLKSNCQNGSNRDLNPNRDWDLPITDRCAYFLNNAWSGTAVSVRYTVWHKMYRQVVTVAIVWCGTCCQLRCVRWTICAVIVCWKYSVWLRLRRVVHGISFSGAVYIFITYLVRADYCNMVLASFKLQRVLNATARLVSGTRKYDRGLSHILHADLHWLDVADRARYKLGVTVHRCLHDKAPRYLVDCCVPVSDIASRQRLRSSRRCFLTVPRHRRIAHSAVGHSQSPDPLSGTCFQTNSETPTALSLHSGSHWRHSTSTSIRVLQRIRGVYDCTTGTGMECLHIRSTLANPDFRLIFFRPNPDIRILSGFFV